MTKRYVPHYIFLHCLYELVIIFVTRLVFCYCQVCSKYRRMPFDIDISGHQFHITERLTFNFRFSWVPLNFTYKYMYPFIPNGNVALTYPHYVWHFLEEICCRQGQASIWSCVERTVSLFRGIAPLQPPTSTWLARWSLALLASWRLETGLKAHQVHILHLMLPHFLF